MPPVGDRARKPRSWAELRWRVLEEGYMDRGELEHRKRWAHRLKYAVWLAPIALAGLIPTWVADGASWREVAAVALIIVGAIDAYVIGRRWEARWDDLIREAGDPRSERTVSL